LVCAVNARRGQPAKRKSHRRTSRQSGRRARSNPSKAASSNWLPFQHAFERLRDRAGSSEDAKDDFEAILRGGVPSLEQKVNFNGEKTCHVRHADFWKDRAYLWVEINVSGADHLRVHYTEYDPSLPDEPGEFFIRATDFEREFERLYPAILHPTTAAPPPAVVEQDAPARKPRPPTAALPPPRRPTSKKPKKTQRTRLISLMEEIGLEKSGLLPHEVRTKVRPQFTKKYRNSNLPADSTIDRAYKTYASATDTSAE
jgi:hypothetical protein